MKRSLVVFALALLLIVGGAAGAFAYVGGAADQVTLTPQVLFGDETAAHGLTVELKDRMGSNLFWDTVHTPGADAETVFDFQLVRYSENGPREYFGVSLSSFYGYSFSGTVDEDTELYGYDKIFSDVASRTAAGEEHSEIIELNDYMDYYPLIASFDLPGSTLRWKTADVDYSQSTGDDFGPINTALAELFPIPIPDGQCEEIRVTKDAAGAVTGCGSNSVGDYAYSPSSQCAVTESACIFYLYNRYEEGSYADFSLTPGGYGLYRLPYSTNGDVTEIRLDALEMAYALSEDENVIMLLTAEGGDRLLLVTERGGEQTLTVLDADTVQPMQRIPLGRGEDAPLARLFDGGDFLAVAYSVYSDTTEGSVAVY